MSNEQRSLILEKIASSMDCENVNIQRLLEILTVTKDVDLQLKLFSVLTVCMISNETYKELIILNNQIYHKVQLLLSQSQPRKVLVLLNFLTTLIYTENTNNLKMKSLSICAQNMIRTSGCLLCMANIFVKDMVFNDTWIALCQCLAETCRDSEENQNYNSYLIPTCLSKCSHGGPEVILFLDSLLKNNERNIKLFLNCNGLNIFTKDTLTDITYMQLLNTLTENSTSANIIIEKTNVVKMLREIIDLYGSNSQAGQWAVIILHRVSSYLKGLEEKQDVTQRVITFPFSKFTKNIVDGNNIKDTEDTTTIFSNLLREIVQMGSKQPLPENDLQEFSKIIDCLKNQNVIPTHYKVKVRKSQSKNSFESKKISPIQTAGRLDYSRGICSLFNISNITSRPTENRMENIDMADNQSNKEDTYVPSLDLSYRIVNQSKESVDDNTINFENVQPIYSSTPNESNVFKNSNKPHRNNNSTYNYPKAIRNRFNATNKHKPIQKRYEIRKSISSKVFSAINDSCATIYNTVKNLFKPKGNTSYEATSTCNVYPDCSFSFTNYMRKRDELTKRNLNNTDEPTINALNYRNVTCRTCNDTMLLRYKLADDEDLKETVKKLKIGINVYGCDFKKISKAFWPKNERMKPAVLYHIYRKLLLK